jgi:hypothetical protein
MCPLFFEAASSTPICCITNTTTKPIFIIEKDYSSLSTTTQEETKQTFAEKLVHYYYYGIVSRGDNSLSTEERFHANNVRPNSSSPSTQHVYSGADSNKDLSIFLSLRVVITYETYRKEKFQLLFALFFMVFFF